MNAFAKGEKTLLMTIDEKWNTRFVVHWLLCVSSAQQLKYSLISNKYDQELLLEENEGKIIVLSSYRCSSSYF